MKNVIKFLSIATLAFTLFACKKDAVPPTKTELLTAHAWKVTAADGTINGVKKDFFATYKACEKDNFTTYKADKTMIDDEGATKCDPSDPQTNQATWQFLTNETQVELTVQTGDPTLPTIKIVYTIVELTTDKTVLKFGDATNNGTITFGKK